MRKFIRLAYGLGFAALFASCQKEQPEIKASKGDYFPTSLDSKWNYSSSWGDRNILSPGRDANTKVEGDTIIGNLTYAKITTTILGEGFNDVYINLIRKENGNYYIKNDINGESIFLKDYLFKGEKWEEVFPITQSEYNKNVYTIIAIDFEREINGNQYLHTIEVKTDYFYLENGKESLISSVTKVYAKNLGLVSEDTEFFPYPGYGKKMLESYDLK